VLLVLASGGMSSERSCYLWIFGRKHVILIAPTVTTGSMFDLTSRDGAFTTLL
jgi:hypothetical protein